jgi:hypothetical protein
MRLFVEMHKASLYLSEEASLNHSYVGTWVSIVKDIGLGFYKNGKG